MSRSYPLRLARPTRNGRDRAGGPAPIHIAERDPFKLERRRERRDAAEGLLCASYSGPGRAGITHLRLVDRSAGGLGAYTRTALKPGMVVTVCPEGSTLAWMKATAVRCEPAGEEGYRVGLRYVGAAAA